MLKRFLILLLLLCPAVFGANTAINAFNAGELSPLLYGRTDLQKYYSGCQTLENMLVMSYGGATRRPGTKYIAEVKDSTKKVRLVPFEYSTEQAYVIEFGDQYLRFYKDGEQIQSGVGTDDLSGVDGGNLVSQWKMNETEGTTATNSDNPGTYDGTISVDAGTITVDGIVDGAFDLDSQYDVTVADDNAFSFTDNSDDSTFSLVCWAKTTNQNELQMLMTKWRNAASTSEWRFSLTNDKKLQLDLTDTSTDISGSVIAQWGLNDDAANTTVVDDSGAGHTATASSNTDTFNDTGKINGALNFAATEYATIADNDDFSFDDSGSPGSKPFSVSAWIFVTATSLGQTILSKRDTNNLEEWYFSITSGEQLQLYLYDESASKFATCESNDALTTGWHFVVATYDSSGGANAADGITLYVDNVEIASTKTTQSGYVAMENKGADLIIGALKVGGSIDGEYADKLDNVMLFSTELTLPQIASLWNDGDGTEDLTTTTPTVSAVSDDTISPGWHFLCATYNAPADETTAADGIILYIDGVAADSTNTNDADYTAMQNGAEEVRIGSQRNTGDTANERFFGDAIDEVSIFNDVLTPVEIASLYSTAPYEISSPYLEADLFKLQYIQSADIMFIAHSGYKQMQLTRSGHTSWTITELDFERGPFIDENETDITITPSAKTGIITLTGSNSVFNSQHPGSIWQISYDVVSVDVTGSFVGTGSSSTTSVELGRSWSFSTGGTWNGTVQLQKSYDAGAIWSTVAGQVYPGSARNISSTGTETVDDAIYRVNMLAHNSGTLTYSFTANGFQLNGVVQIDSVTDSLTATGTVLVDLGDTAATKLWSEGAWSDFRGFPSTLAFFEERLTFAATTYQPQTIWFSETNAWTSFRNDTGDSDAMTFTIAADQVNAINWMIPRDSLIMGTTGAEWTIGSLSTDTALTPTSVKAVRHSTYGSTDLQAIAVNNVVLFPQKQARKIRELVFSFELDNYVAPDMTVLSEHITESGIVNMGYQQVPDAILWTVLDNGNIADMTYNREQDVVAWHRHTTDGEFESVAIIPGDEDEIWVSVKRNINSADVRYVEQFQPRDYGDDQDDAFYVDSGFTYDSTATTTITGLDHLEGETVNVLGDGLMQADKTVSSGSITITSASTVQVGMPYTSILSPMKINIPLQDGTMMGRTKIIRELVMRFNKTSTCKAGPTLTNASTLNFDEQPFTGDYPLTWRGSYERDGNMVLFTDDPLPVTVLSLMPRYEVNSR